MILVDYIDRGARVAHGEPCLIDPRGEVLMTHAEFCDVTHRIAAALAADGVRIGDRVAVYSPNHPLALACVVGIIRAGAVWTAVNAGAGVDEISEFVDSVGCSHLIYHETLVERASTLITRLPALKTAVAIGTGRQEDPTLETWLAPPGARVLSQHAQADDVVALAGTGGTTGRSKAVPITNRQLVLMCLAFNAHLAERDPPRYICATPMTHAAGALTFPVLAEGGSIVVHNGVKAADILASIEANRATRIFLPPTALYALLAHPQVRGFDYSSLRHFIIGAAPIAPDRLSEAVDVFGPVMTEVYGQVEAPMICTVLTPEDIFDAVSNTDRRRRLSSCGRPSYVASVEIMDDSGHIVGPEQPGEIVVHSDLVFAAYFHNDEATEETRRPGGWHGTGDIGLRDEDGFIYVIDRKKDMIITGGFNVFPSQIEAVIHGFPEVNDCAVIGVPDEKWGEAVTAVIEPKPGQALDIDAILAACRHRLGPVKTPKTVLTRTLPRSANGKVLKRELRDEYWQARDRKV